MKTLIVAMIALSSVIASASNADGLDCKGVIAKEGAKNAITIDLKEDAFADHTLSAQDAKNKVEFRVVALPANQVLMSIYEADSKGNMMTEAQVTATMSSEAGAYTLLQGRTAKGADVMLSCQNK